jgi:hypothetical protein
MHSQNAFPKQLVAPNGMPFGAKPYVEIVVHGLLDGAE